MVTISIRRITLAKRSVKGNNRFMIPRRFLTLFLVVCMAITAFSTPAPSFALQTPDKLTSPTQNAPYPANLAALTEEVHAKGTINLIVGIKTATVLQESSSALVIASQSAQARVEKMSLLARLGNSVVTSGPADWIFPVISLRVNALGLEKLKNDRAVASIEEDIPVPVELYNSTPWIGATKAWAHGFTGAGWYVAIADTGVASGHPFLTGKVAVEACFSNSGNTHQSLCPNGQLRQYGPGAAYPNAVCRAVLGCTHGTHVAGIAAGKNGVLNGIKFNGVAPAAKIVALQIFTRFNSASDCYPSAAPCLLTYRADQLSALNYVYILTTQGYHIASVNLSLGGDIPYTSACDTLFPNYLKAVITLRAVNVPVVAAAGNNGWTNALSFPACLSNVISVGATFSTSDQIADFSNSSPVLKLLAPGVSITSSIFGPSYGALSGTSMAAPHVTGAWALMKQKYPNETVTQILNRFRSTGVSVYDPGNGITRPRIRVDLALGL